MLHERVFPTAFASQRSKELRRDQTKGEKILWIQLRANRFHGRKFRRQVPIGPYIVDFLCVPANLIIEVDGVCHETPTAKKHDRLRDAYLRSLDFSILRFSNDDVVEATDDVLGRIGEILDGIFV